ncbi:MAG: helicase [Actinomycetia bacterium]|nr:helicase [Actinomycetes bacterium]
MKVKSGWFQPRLGASEIPGRTPLADRFPDALAAGTPADLRRDLEALLGADKVFARAIDLVRYATDASPCRLIPQDRTVEPNLPI